MNKPRKQTYTMDMYLNKMKDRDIRSDADVQRLAGNWSKEHINELIVTVLTEDYIPPIILGEENSSQLWIIDGLQRSTALMKFRFANYKITSAVEDSVVAYKSKNVDENGAITWEDACFDIKNKTYKDLPEELKKKFNEYQVETVIHEECNMKRISKLIKRYNNHTSMNTSQKAFVYAEKFARKIRSILDGDFFLNCGTYTEKERTKGVLERVVLETVMCMFHINNWNKNTKQIAQYLNENSSEREFEILSTNLSTLENIVDEDSKHLFNSKDSFIWLTLFNNFLNLNVSVEKFAGFLHEFTTTLCFKEINGITFNEVDKGKGTKDKVIVKAKLEFLQKLLCDYLQINYSEELFLTEKDFVSECVGLQPSTEDIELYEDIFDDLSVETDADNPVLKQVSKHTWLSVVCFACMNEIDLDKWFIDFCSKNHDFFESQKENYNYMKENLENFVRGDI